ncbi:MAG: DUF3488 and transglutaminase-like domain-containing protein [Thermoguttaceae bacterium]|nr:DUF3488 and transglutaminase-like domain-containing protein [Thermoguttaceae bacterium]MDW8038696.1 DUF3488 and transglutaminase-like domain-containing protein [Thermoguttaceae bacterium]
MDSVALGRQQTQRWLQIHIAGLAALGTLLLGLGQGDVLWPGAMAMAAAASVVLTDMTGYFRLSRTAANLIALGVVLWVLKDVRQWTGFGQVLIISKLLVYLQLILLFQQKDYRAYWQLAMISLLQVVVAAAFQQGVLFGLLLVGYFLLAVWTMILFFLYRETHRQPPEPLSGRFWPVWELVGKFLLKGRLWLKDSWLRAPFKEDGKQSPGALGEGVVLAKDRQGQPEERARPAQPGLWPLSGQVASLQGGQVPTGSGLGWSLVRPLSHIAVVSWTFTLGLFFVIPRPSTGAWRGVALPLRHAVGFTDQVALGELGRIIQKSDEVLRIRFFDPQQRPYGVEGPLYLRGAILHHYQHGHWRFSERRVFPLQHPLARKPVVPYRPLVLQEITIEPMDRQELFCLWPYAAVDPNIWLIEDRARRRLLRPEENCRERYTYILWTTALEQGSQAPLNPFLFPEDVYWDSSSLLQMPRRDGQSSVPSLEALARQWVQQAGISLEQRMNVARLLEARLKLSGRFRYSLQGQPRNPQLDPIEDFITEHPEGHCEYFATALALMLRSLGIPCRVVVGYLCDEWNPAGQFFQVRQWHAHMWVEAYLKAEHLPSSLTEGEYGWLWKHGAWLRLDPTPIVDPLQDQPFYIRWASRLHTLWANYIVELDRFRQTEGIYKPLQEAFRNLVQRLQDPAWWSGLASDAGQWVGRFFAEWHRRGWFSWQGFVVTFFLGLVGGSLVLLGQKILRRLRGQSPTPHVSALTRRVVEFYFHMETLLAAHGFRRLPGQTPMEFALRAGTALSQRLQDPQWQHLPAQVVDAFYRVRFGAQVLSPAYSQQIAHILESLKKALFKAIG